MYMDERRGRVLDWDEEGARWCGEERAIARKEYQKSRTRAKQVLVGPSIILHTSVPCVAWYIVWRVCRVGVR